MSGKAKKQQNSERSSASSAVSTGPVNWQGNPQYYEYLLGLREKDNPDSWKSDLEKMQNKFPGVNFTIDGIQSYHKKQQEHIRIAEKAVSESEAFSDSNSSSGSGGMEQEKPSNKEKEKATKSNAKSDSEADAKNELIRVTLQTEIKELTQKINGLELELEKKNSALELHMKTINKK